MSESKEIFTMHKHVYSSPYYLMNNRLPFFIKYFDSPLITFQNDNFQLLYLNKKNFNHILYRYFILLPLLKNNSSYLSFVAEMHGKQ